MKYWSAAREDGRKAQHRSDARRFFLFRTAVILVRTPALASRVVCYFPTTALARQLQARNHEVAVISLPGAGP